MKKILLLGAGKSTPVLINYLLDEATAHNWQLIVADYDIQQIQKRLHDHPKGIAVQVSIDNQEDRLKLIKDSDIVISMLPPRFHPLVAEDCLRFGKNMVTASYESDEIKAMAKDIREKGLLFINECGLDPGIDHITGMHLLDKVREKGGEIIGYETFTGGLVAPESDDNPWNYKFTWNPKNVVTAGQGGVKFLQEGKYKYIPYHRLFRRTEIIHIPGYGDFEGYANRDSLKYRERYGLQNAKTVYRGTLRRPGFCRSWDIFVQLGATDDSYRMEHDENFTKRDFINAFLAYHPTDSVELKLAHYLHLDLDSHEMYKLKWLGVFDDEPIGLKNATPAENLLKILEGRWQMKATDKDMIVMWHKLDYLHQGKHYQIQASMVVIGDDAVHSAMAKTVGLPLGIAVKMILTGKITIKGLHIPVVKEIYTPILAELQRNKINLIEREIVVEN